MFGKTHIPYPRADDKILVLKYEAGLIVWDASYASTAEITLLGNGTLVIRNYVDGQPLNLFVLQDQTGSRTLSFDASLSVKWPASAPPGWSTAVGATDILSILSRNKVLHITHLKGFGP